MIDQHTRRTEGGFARGVGVGLLLHLLQIPMAIGTAMFFDSKYHGFAGLTGLMLPFYIGVSQLVYLVPAIWIMAVKGDMHTVRGLCLAGILTCIGQASCYVVLTPAHLAR